MFHPPFDPPPPDQQVELLGPRRTNQHLPSPPDADLFPLVHFYFYLGLSDRQIASQVMDHFDRKVYGLRRRTLWNLKSTRQTKATWEDIEPYYHILRTKFPNMGARGMVQNLRLRFHVKVPEALLNRLFQLVEPMDLARRKRKQFRRKRFWAAGVMDILAFDQHDKWKRFGLWMHVGLNPYASRIAWMRIWWTNRNPKLIASYYLHSGRKIGGGWAVSGTLHRMTARAGIPLITQSDPGSENYSIANCQTVTRQRLDPLLIGTLQHRWMNKQAMNIKPEAMWSLLRRNWTPGFETKLEEGMDIFDLGDPLKKLVFRWLAIPWLQKELDKWVRIHNLSPHRADKHKVLLHGIPNMITSKPEMSGTRDYKVVVTPEMFDQMEAEWAPPDDPVFLLIPPTFEAEATELYGQMGRPEVNFDSFWDVYSDLLAAFWNGGVEHLQDNMEGADNHFESSVELMDVADLPQGDAVVGNWGYLYYGGLAEPPLNAADKEQEEDEDEEEDDDDDDDGREFAQYAVFTDDEAD
ncbi:hypothetical protein B0H19DRAFT_1251786 [Mycena capillaripes]|nr:hypothetical protein B0H19DRAFT_1251786 [Mycena capillaripes]